MRWLRQGPSLLVRTPAKLNLCLEVLGRRQDGYHNLETVMVSVRLFDVLRLTPRETPEIGLRCQTALSSSELLPEDDRNLVVRAARLLQQSTGCQRGADVDLWKGIPSQAGLGGGSSDAAATLAGLNVLWELNLPPVQLHALAAQLGSDVNFFLENAPAALCAGRGESTQPMGLSRRLEFIVIQPSGGLATRDVFAQWSRESGQSPRGFARLLAQGLDRMTDAALGRALRNDLQPAACGLHRGVGELLPRLARLDVAGAALTGSGSACFAVCRSARHARRVAAQVQAWNLGNVFQISSGV